jgi:hypothetical protein
VSQVSIKNTNVEMDQNEGLQYYFLCEYDWTKYDRGWWKGGKLPNTLEELLQFTREYPDIKYLDLKCNFIRCETSYDVKNYYYILFYKLLESDCHKILAECIKVQQNQHPDVNFHFFYIDHLHVKTMINIWKQKLIRHCRNVHLVQLITDFGICDLDAPVYCYNSGISVGTKFSTFLTKSIL